MNEALRNKDRYHNREFTPTTDNPNVQFWWYRGYDLTEEQVREAIENTTNNQEAAKYVGIGYRAWRKYAKKYIDRDTGKSLFQIQLEKYKNNRKPSQVKIENRSNWKSLLTENKKPTESRINKLKKVLIEKNKLKNKCNRCGFGLSRVEDNKVPLMLFFKNGDKTNWRLENLELVCYNCSFLYCLDFYKETLINRVESIPLEENNNKGEVAKFYQLDEFYLDYMKQLGMETSDISPHSLNPLTSKEDDGSEFIDRL